MSSSNKIKKVFHSNYLIWVDALTKQDESELVRFETVWVNIIRKNTTCFVMLSGYFVVLDVDQNELLLYDIGCQCKHVIDIEWIRKFKTWKDSQK